MRVCFGGGGDADDERPVLDVFARWVGSRSVLYLPIASDPPYEPQLEWVSAALRASGVTNVHIATELEGLAEVIRRAEALFIGGGNAYTLLYALRRTGADGAVHDVAESGRPVYGGSAGAILLGRDIGTARHADANIPGLTDTTGLDLALGYSVWCHHLDRDASSVRDYVRATGIGVIALSERSGLIRDDGSLRVAGHDPATAYGSRTDTIVPVGASVPPVDRR